jgi:hypothetical protein
MKVRPLVFFAMLTMMFPAGVFARQSVSLGKDDVLIQASTGERWVGHQQSERSFITCSGTVISLGEGDKVMHGASCTAQRSALRLGVQRGISTYATAEGYGLTKLDEVNSIGKYALASWTGESGKRGHAVLVNDGTAWHVLSFGKISEKEVLARGVPRDTFTELLAARP